MSEYILPNNRLRVVIRDDSPMVFCGDTPSYRSVELALTDEQVNALRLRKIGTQGTRDLYEAISTCFIEPNPPHEE